MALKLKVYQNGDHACLVWRPDNDQSIPSCRGFAIRRTRNGKSDYLHGFVGFSAEDKLDPQAPWKFPVQRYMWWDYTVDPGDQLQYEVVPVTGSAGNLALAPALGSGPSPRVTIGSAFAPHVSAYFNKGILSAQWVSRALQGVTDKQTILSLVATKGNALRNALSGLLRPALLDLLAQARKGGGTIYACLYELNDPELIQGLEALGKSCNLILGNGAFKSNTAPDNDENRAARRQLKGKVRLYNRIVKQGHFAHNKFVVFCDAAGQAQKVLTGSTNWTTTGLCTQTNNAIVIEDAKVAGAYLEAWNRLKDAKNDYPAALVTGNSRLQRATVDGFTVTPWFARTSQAQELVQARQRIASAREGILFLFFNPGTFQEDPVRQTLLQNVLERHRAGGATYDPSLYLCGVVNQDIPRLTTVGPTGKTHAAGLDPANPPPVMLYRNGYEDPTRLGHDVIVPHNIREQFAAWAKELSGVSIVNVHSKVIVIDPFGAHPVLITGSHNLGFKASSANDDNLVIVEDSPGLAQAYAIHILAIDQTYRWNHYVETHRKAADAWHGPVDNDQWQAGHLTGDDLKELQFWMGSGALAAAGGNGARHH
jgi:phosphatidylserine/phosphatidylglycerophosphate/cardiolipin synthase-like enzyme